MPSDFKSPTDQLKPSPGDDTASKARDNVAQLTEMLEREDPQVKFKAMTDGQGEYDKETNTIVINEENKPLEQQDPALLEPLLEHERVHARYRSDDPQDEDSLQAYVDEEFEAYQVQASAWEAIKADYADPDKQAALGDAGRKLMAHYDFWATEFQRTTPTVIREDLEKTYRRRMNKGK